MLKKVKPIKKSNKKVIPSLQIASGVQNCAVNKSDQKLIDILE